MGDMWRALAAVVISLSSSLGASASALAAEGPVKRPHVEVQLVPEVTHVRPGLPFWVALRMKMEDGWHVYWKNPGDSGTRPGLDWKLPEGLAAGPIEWPFPEKIRVAQLVNYGYEGEVLLMSRMEASPDLKGDRVELRAKADWLICKEVCIPGKADLELLLPVKSSDPRFDPDWGERFEKERKRHPQVDPSLKAEASATRDRVRVVLETPALASRSVDEVSFFVENEDLVEASAPDGAVLVSGRLEYSLVRAQNVPGQPDRLRGVLVLRPDERAIAVDVPLGKGAAGAGLPLMLLFAFLGGILLNIMPCVFPVLGVKVLGFVEIARENPGRIRKHGLAFGAGTLVTFWVLAGVLIALRAAGQQLGWGFQLQTPGFVAFLAFLFFGLAAPTVSVTAATPNPSSQASSP
jgi:DsbC/DsbD-like thiol-disulfide interchange protein